MQRTIPLIALVLALGGCATMDKPADLGRANLIQSNGEPAGPARLIEVDGKISLSLALAGLPAGTHGFHLHTTGTCTGPDFKSAGGHLNPFGKQHGTDNPAGSHVGDLPNLVVGADGAATLSIPLSENRSELMAQLFDQDGTAIVIHDKPDDYKTDPAGNAGDRIACGVLMSS
jgi:Cu-Zn family superoxide dismutase